MGESMMRVTVSGRVGVVVVTAWVGVLSVACQTPPATPAAPAATQGSSGDEMAALKADIETLKGKATSASVAMADVGYHFSNLWFAGQARNWPLATYYYNEGRNHVRWLIRINPTPKGPDGMPVDLKGIFDAIDTTTFASLKAVIDAKDAPKFEAAYRTVLESCYQCHKAVGRPYLRPMVPKTPPQTIINLDAEAKWPQ